MSYLMIYLFILFSDFVQRTRCIKQKDTYPHKAYNWHPPTVNL